VNHPVGGRPRSVVACDVDDDDDNDLAVANQGSNSVSILLNDGDGDFDLVTSNYYTDDITILFNLTNTHHMSGDANGDGLIDVGRVVYLTGFLYKDGSAPDPLWTGDCNCDDTVNLGDVVYLINYLFRAGPPPGC